VWISSFVVTLDVDSPVADETQAALSAIPAFEVGELVGAKLPVVVETDDGATARDWFEWTCRLPGVVHVDVAFVGFDETTATHSEADPTPAVTLPSTRDQSEQQGASRRFLAGHSSTASVSPLVNTTDSTRIVESVLSQPDRLPFQGNVIHDVQPTA